MQYPIRLARCGNFILVVALASPYLYGELNFGGEEGGGAWIKSRCERLEKVRSRENESDSVYNNKLELLDTVLVQPSGRLEIIASAMATATSWVGIEVQLPREQCRKMHCSRGCPGCDATTQDQHPQDWGVDQASRAGWRWPPARR